MQAQSGSNFSFIVVFVICFLEGADQAMIGATMKSLEEDLGLTPFTLGLMAFAQACGGWSGPIWGWMDDTGWGSRRQLMAFATCGWGAMMILTAVSVQPAMLMVVRLFNGLFIASLTPLTQTFVVDHVAAERRGSFFGYMGAAQAVGSILCTTVTTYIASMRFQGVAGWRLSSFAVGTLSICMSFFVRAVMEDGNKAALQAKKVGRTRGLCEMFGEVFANLSRHWTVPTFRIIIYQGVFGSIPWRAFGFEQMFLLYVGFSRSQISLLTLACAPIRIFGSTIGGYVGDWASRQSRDHGRPWTALFSVASGIPCVVVMLTVLPARVGPSLTWYIILYYIFYATATWCGSGVNRPILNDVVDPTCRASIIAWDAAIEGLFASTLGMPFLGFIADACFGYTPTKVEVAGMPPALQQHNFEAIRNAMLVMMVTPWVLCFLLYMGLHFTYKSDMQKVEKRVDHTDQEVSEETPLIGEEDVKDAVSYSKRAAAA